MPDEKPMPPDDSPAQTDESEPDHAATAWNMEEKKPATEGTQPDSPVSQGEVPVPNPSYWMVYTIGLGICVILLVIMASITNAHSGATTYEEAAGALSDANALGYLLAVLLGAMAAFRMAHARPAKRGRAIKRIILIVLGFVFGFVPGFILMSMITYPLSQRACELSGSKYC
jgi:hypothetical protein